MNVSKSAIACALVAALGSSAWVMAKDEDDIAKAPAAVQATVKKTLGDKKAEGFDKETADGKAVYELSYKVDDADHTTVIAEDGKVTQEETEIEESKVPAAVLEAAKKTHEGAKVDECALVTADGKTFYEIDVKVKDDTHAIKLSKDAMVISDEIEKPEVDEKDKK